jgi:hypothetical protein
MLVFCTAILSILRPFGTFCGHFVYFSAFVCCTEKNLATLRLPNLQLHTTPRCSRLKTKVFLAMAALSMYLGSVGVYTCGEEVEAYGS